MNINLNSQNSQYDIDKELDRLYSGISGRSFSYNPSADPLYRSYADRYAQNGRMAMRDTMGQAASLTGGYGSTYSQSVGQQQYNEYLRSLSDVLPQLYGMARDSYNSQTAQLQSSYDMLWQRREDDYQREQDEYDKQRLAAEDAREAEQQGYKRTQDAYDKLYKLITGTGYQAADADLQASGMTRAQADALRTEFLRKNGLLPGQNYAYYPKKEEERKTSSGGSVAKGKTQK